MPKFIRQYQNIVHCKDAHKIGFIETKEATAKMLNEFFEDIVHAVMSEEEGAFLIQMAISKIEKYEIQ
jgi:hypothetical protein